MLATLFSYDLDLGWVPKMELVSSFDHLLKVRSKLVSLV